VAVLDIGSYSVKAMRKNSTAEVVLAEDTIGGTFTIPFLDTEKFSEALRGLQRSIRLSPCHVLLPDQWARQLFLTIEGVPEGYTKDYLIWRAKEQIRDEIHEGCKICVHVTASRETAGEKTSETSKKAPPADKKTGRKNAPEATASNATFVIDAYVCLVKEDILQSVNEVFASAGVDIASVDLTSHSVYNYIAQNADLKPDFVTINIGYEVTTVYFYAGYQPVYVRIIETAGKHFFAEMGENSDKTVLTGGLMARKIFPAKLDARELDEFDAGRSAATDKLLKELHLTFEFFASKFPRVKLAEVYLSGGFCKVPGIDGFLANFFDMRVVLAADAGKIQFTPLAGIKE